MKCQARVLLLVSVFLCIDFREAMLKHCPISLSWWCVIGSTLPVSDWMIPSFVLPIATTPSWRRFTIISEMIIKGLLLWFFLGIRDCSNDQLPDLHWAEECLWYNICFSVGILSFKSDQQALCGCILPCLKVNVFLLLFSSHHFYKRIAQEWGTFFPALQFLISVK